MSAPLIQNIKNKPIIEIFHPLLNRRYVELNIKGPNIQAVPGSTFGSRRPGRYSLVIVT